MTSSPRGFRGWGWRGRGVLERGERAEVRDPTGGFVGGGGDEEVAPLERLAARLDVHAAAEVRLVAVEVVRGDVGGAANGEVGGGVSAGSRRPGSRRTVTSEQSDADIFPPEKKSVAAARLAVRT